MRGSLVAVFCLVAIACSLARVVVRPRAGGATTFARPLFSLGVLLLLRGKAGCHARVSLTREALARPKV